MQMCVSEGLAAPHTLQHRRSKSTGLLNWLLRDGVPSQLHSSQTSPQKVTETEGVVSGPSPCAVAFVCVRWGAGFLLSCGWFRSACGWRSLVSFTLVSLGEFFSPFPAGHAVASPRAPRSSSAEGRRGWDGTAVTRGHQPENWRSQVPFSTYAGQYAVVGCYSGAEGLQRLWVRVSHYRCQACVLSSAAVLLLLLTS